MNQDARLLHLLHDRHRGLDARQVPLHGVVADPLLVEEDGVLGHDVLLLLRRTSMPTLYPVYETTSPVLDSRPDIRT